jgi:hypothetical protein
VQASTIGTLATISEDGSPWASLVAYAPRARDGVPLLCVSDLAEHGRNLRRDPRASLVVAEQPPSLDQPRVTLSGRVTRSDDRATFLAAVPDAQTYIDFQDFTLYALIVERVRWVAGFGRMETIDAADYLA